MQSKRPGCDAETHYTNKKPRNNAQPLGMDWEFVNLSNFSPNPNHIKRVYYEYILQDQAFKIPEEKERFHSNQTIALDKPLEFLAYLGETEDRVFCATLPKLLIPVKQMDMLYNSIDTQDQTMHKGFNEWIDLFLEKLMPQLRSMIAMNREPVINGLYKLIHYCNWFSKPIFPPRFKEKNLKFIFFIVEVSILAKELDAPFQDWLNGNLKCLIGSVVEVSGSVVEVSILAKVLDAPFQDWLNGNLKCPIGSVDVKSFVSNDKMPLESKNYWEHFTLNDFRQSLKKISAAIDIGKKIGSGTFNSVFTCELKSGNNTILLFDEKHKNCLDLVVYSHKARKVALRLAKKILYLDSNIKQLNRTKQWLMNHQHPNIIDLLPPTEVKLITRKHTLASFLPTIATMNLKQYIFSSNNKGVHSTSFSLIMGICSGLAHLHDQSLVHRDLSWNNILLLDNKPILTDFDNSGIVGESVSELKLYVGTCKFAHRYANTIVATEHDIFSLAIIMWHLLSRKNVFDHEKCITDNDYIDVHRSTSPLVFSRVEQEKPLESILELVRDMTTIGSIPDISMVIARLTTISKSLSTNHNMP